MTIRALIFDFDGLIIDSESPELLAWQEVFVEHGCELSLEVWADCVGRPPGFFDPCEHLVQLSGRVVDTESVRARVRSRARKIVFEQTPLPGVVEWLASAWSLELRVGIASSSHRGWVEAHLSRLQLVDRFDPIVCNEDTPHHKPDPAPYLLVAERMGIHPAEAVALEDSPHGVKAAKAAGMFCIAVPNPVTRQFPFEESDLRLGSLADLSLEEAIAKLSPE